jgi:hypothetical protein
MRYTIALVLVAAGFVSFAQTVFPVKMNNRWGLINSEGSMIIKPEYEAIGDFKNYGYAVMQRSGKVGLLDQHGREIVNARFEDLRVLDSARIAVMDQGQWMVIDLNGKIVLAKGYDRLQLWDGGFLAFRVQNKWGVLNQKGVQIVAPKYDEILLRQGRFFLTNTGGQKGLVLNNGTEVLTPQADQIDIISDSLFFFRKGNLWGAADGNGKSLAPTRYTGYSRISTNFYRLQGNGKPFLLSILCKGVITNGEYENYYPLSNRYVVTRKNQRLGLIDWCGRTVLSPRYDEILWYSPSVFRVNVGGKWALIKQGDSTLTSFQYTYIAPPKGRISVVKIGQAYGVINYLGKEIVKTNYRRIVLEPGQARAYRTNIMAGGAEMLDLLRFDDEGNLVSGDQLSQHFRIKVSGKNRQNNTVEKEEESYILDKFEWFFDAAKDRWGLRDISDGSIKITPAFQWIKVDRALGLTLVAIPTARDYEFERTTYRFDHLLGVVSNDLGALVSELNYWDIHLEDFHAGNPYARCLAANGRYGLMDKRGKQVQQGFAYIGPFKNGLARMSLAGRLSASMKSENNLGTLHDFMAQLPVPGRVIDYTQYDQVFKDNAKVVCENCEWGYIDTAGKRKINPQFTFAEDFVNEVGIVQLGNKWGVINQHGKPLIPCQYDAIRFLENTNNRILSMYVQRPKYGLIDTLGQLAVNAIYDEIGSFREDRLAVARNGLWGFVDHDGLEVIPCRFREVGNFHEGLASVKLGRFWGFIDKLGNEVINFKFRKVGNFGHGLAWVETEDGLGYANHEGKLIIPAFYEQATDFDHGVARVRLGGKYGLINTKGQSILKPKYNTISAFNAYGLAIATQGSENTRTILINRKGMQVGNQSFIQIHPFSEGLAVVKEKNGYGYIDTLGRLIIPAVYHKAGSFSQGRAAVYRDGTCGYLSHDGQSKVPFNYTRCQDFADGRAVVFQGMRKAGLIDTSGQQVLEPSINRILDFSEGVGLVRDEQYRFYFITEQATMYNAYYQQASGFNHGVAVVQVNGKWGIINRRGMEVVAPKYSQIEAFENGYAKVKVEGFNGLSNLKGQLIVSPDFEYIRYAGDGVFRVEQGDKIGYFDSTGNWIWSLSN